MKKVQRFKKVITSILLLIALLTVQVMQVAAETDQNDTPSVVCSDYSSLYQAFIQANDGDVIGIDNIIDIQAEGGTFGSSDKHVTIVKVNDGAMIQVSTRTPFTFKNITFDGKDITSYNSMINVGFNTNFEDVTFQNCKCVFDGCGGAVTITGGTVNLTGCIFLNNTSQSGGHLYVMNDSQVTITGCTFEGGNGVKGGAINQSNGSSYIEVNSSKVYGNTASESGGGIYGQGRMVIQDSKVFGNTAPVGEDITDTVFGNVQIQDDLNVLQQLFSDENITVNGWITTTDENTASIYRKFDYVVNTTPDPGDNEDPGDSGNDNPSGTDEPTDPSDPGSGDSGSGDDSGNTGGDSNNEDPSTPSDPSDSNGDQGDSSGTGGNGGSGNTEQPGTGSDSSDQGSSGAGDNTSTDNSNNSTTDNSSSNSTTSIDNSSNDTTTDNSDHGSTSTNTTTSTDSSQTTSNSGNTSTSNTTTDNRRTESSDNHSSTTYNYYQTEQTPVQQPQVQSEQAKEPVIINNYIQPSEQGQTASQEQQVDIPASEPEQQAIPAPDPSNNIRIDAKGADVVFEVKDGVYSISINASEPVQDASASVSETKSSVNWYEIIKIVLLAALVVNMLRKPIKETTKC